MTSDRIPAPAEGVEAIASGLSAAGVELVVLSFVDNAGIARIKSVPVRQLPAAARYGVGMSPCFETFRFDDVMAFSRYLGGPDGDLRLVPDLRRLVKLSAAPGWAWSPADKFTQDGKRFVACQRAFAAAQIAAAAEQGLRLRMAFETEWALGESGAEQEFVPAFSGSAYGLLQWEAVAAYARDLVAALHAQQLSVEQFHPEYAPAQLELSIAPNDPVGAADDVLLVRHTIRRVSAAHGWRASFAPIVVVGGPGSGGHLHFSVHDEDGNMFAGGPGPWGMRGGGESFLAGVLRELPALTAVGAGNPASFLRLQPSCWAGVWQCWGHETREAAVRFVSGTIGTGSWAANAEVKCFDATANPYLLVGAVIAAGLAGVAERLRLPEPIVGDPAEWQEEQRRRAGVRRLPTSGKEAADALAASEVLAEAMGEVLHDALLTVRRAEAEAFGASTPEELTALTRWRW